MRFSIIIPLYNKAPYVGKALSSVLDQTFNDYELIVVDDGSTDTSFSIVKDFTESNFKGCVVSIIQQANAGVSTARNNGVKASHGEYICFFDADDWWEPTFLEEMSSLIDKYPNAGIYGTGYHIVKNGRNRVAPIGVDDSFDDGIINYCRVYAKTLCMPLWTGAVCMPRKVYEEFDGFRSHLKLGEDFDLWIKVALKYPVAFLNKPLSNYNQDVDITYRGTHRLHDPKVHMLWNLDYLAEEEKTNPDYKQLIDNLRTYSLFPYYLNKSYRDAARKELKKVDWSLQSQHWVSLYRMPIMFLKCRQSILKLLSAIKQNLLK